MKVMEYRVFALFALLLAGHAHGQKITLLDNFFFCKGCELSLPPVPKSQIVTELAPQESLSAAAEKIKHYFTSENDHFILFCKTCSAAPRTIGYIRRAKAGAVDKGFGTYISLQTGGHHKGERQFYKLRELGKYLTDSLLVFDSIQLSTARLTDAGQDELSTLRASYQYNGTTIEREIPYNAEKRSYNISYSTFFDNGLSRAITDTIPVLLNFRKTVIPGELKIFFATAEEKQDMAELFSLYKQLFPGWTKEEIADELLAKITAKYKNASKPNFVAWLKNQ